MGYSYDGRTQLNQEEKPQEKPSAAPKNELSGYHQSVPAPAYGQYGSGGYGKEVACKQREETVCTNTPRHKTSKLVKRVKRRCARKSMNANHTLTQNLIVETKERRCVTLNKKLNPNKSKSTATRRFAIL